MIKLVGERRSGTVGRATKVNVASRVKREQAALPTTLILKNKIDQYLGQCGQDPEVYGLLLCLLCSAGKMIKISRECRACR